MGKSQIQSLVAIAAPLLVAAAIGWAGSQGSVRVGDVSLFVLCGLISFGLNWLAFIPAYVYQTEHYFDPAKSS